jgi:hypothetical protein
VLEDRLFVDDILNATIGEPEGERPDKPRRLPA